MHGSIWCENVSKIIKSFGLPSPDGESVSEYALEGTGSADKCPADVFFCPACIDNVPADRTFAMHCKHTFCTTCWTDGVSQAVVRGRWRVAFPPSSCVCVDEQ